MAAAHKMKIINELAVAIDRLSPHSRATLHKISFRNLRYQSSQRADESWLAERSVGLGEAGSPISQRHSPESGEAELVDNVCGPKIALVITFAFQGQYSVGAGFDFPRNSPGEVHAEEWEAGIGHRINQRAHEGASLRG